MDARPAPARLPLHFHGNAWEYFRIWIVNICLTTVTLGLYAPWAKVRQQRYFYGCTQLAEGSFDYLANPVAILKGRIVAFGLLLIAATAAEFSPKLTAAFWLAFIVALPWLIIRSRRFHAANTVYRNIPFGFTADYGQAFVSFIALPLIILPVSFGLAYPWVLHNQKQFLLEHSRYGNTAFTFTATTGDFRRVFVRLLLAGVLLLVIVGLLIVASSHLGTALHAAVSILNSLLTVAAFLTAAAYMDAAINNIVWNHTRLGNIGFVCQLQFPRLLVLQLTNLLAILLSIGLLIPWAKIRMARYRLSCLALCCEPMELEGFLVGASQSTSALGEELSDLLEVDIGL